MLTRDHYFPGQTSGEQICLFIRRHWMSFLGWIIMTILAILIPAGYLAAFLSNTDLTTLSPAVRGYIILGASAYLLLLLAVFLTAWIAYYLDVMIVTEHRLVDIEQSGLLNRKISEQSLLRVQDVTTRMTGVLQTFFNYGTVYVETAGEAPNFTISNIPRPNDVAKTILDLHERLVEGGGHERAAAMAEGEVLPMGYHHAALPPVQGPEIQELQQVFPGPSEEVSPPSPSDKKSSSQEEKEEKKKPDEEEGTLEEGKDVRF